MANIKISDLTAAAAASGTQEFEVNDSLTSKKVTGAQILSYVQANTTPASIGALANATDAVSATNLASNSVTTVKIADNNVTLAKLPDIATASILGRTTAGTGDPEVLTGAQARSVIGADNASNLTSGTVGTARLASGTANSTTFLRGDQTWATAGGVTSLTAGNGITVSASTGAVTVSQDIYTGTTVNNSSYPVGTYVLGQGGTQPFSTNVNASATIWSPPTTGSFYFTTNSSGSGSASLAGTWRSRGSGYTSGACGQNVGTLFQRTA